MPNISKLAFDKFVTTNTPCSIFHPWEGDCIKAIKINVKNGVVGCSKTILTVYIIKLILNWRKVSIRYLIRLVLQYFRSVLYLSATYNAIPIAFCFTSRYHFGYYTYFLVAFAVAAVTIHIESHERRGDDYLFMINQLLLTSINYLILHKVFKRTIWTETAAFMTITPLLMYLFKTRKSEEKIKHMWFYPEKSVYLKNNSETKTLKCDHEDVCLKYCYKGFFNYFIAGYSVEIIRRLIPKISKVFFNSKLVMNLLLNISNVRMGMFFGSYAAIYRLLSCYLKRRDGKSSLKHTLISAFVAGTTYCIKPNIFCLTIAISTTLQLLWERVPYKLNTPNCISYPNIMLALSYAVAIHSYAFMYDNCSKTTNNMIEICTNRLSKDVPTLMSHLLREAQKSQTY